MYSVMIVDDEDLVLKSFTFTIQNHAPDFEVCAQATSGLEAIELIEIHHPEIVIMDIAMPGIDGLETIQRIRERYTEIQFILSTAYERFDLAQRAIPLGVFRYLVKPVGKATLLEALKHAGELVDSQRRKARNERTDARLSSHSQRFEQEHFMQELLCGNLTPEAWEYYLSKLNVSSEGGFIFIVAGPPDTKKETLKRQYEVFIEWVSHRVQCFSLDIGRLVLFISTRRDSGFFESDLLKEMERIFDSGVRGGCGSRREYAQMQESYQEALTRLTKEIPQQPDDADYIQQIRGKLKRCDEYGQEVFLEHLEEYWNFLIQHFSFDVARSKVLVLVSLMLDDLPHSPGQFADPAVELTPLESPDQVVTWLLSLGRVICESMGLQQRKDLPRPLHAAIVEIHQNYASPIQLSGLAEGCGVNPNYLSRLFKEYLQTNFVDYLNSIRLQRAEELMTSGELSLKEISWAVGYQDPNYFSRIFKKHRGVSPKEFQRRQYYET